MSAPCPPQEQLEQFLDDRLETSEDAALAARLASPIEQENLRETVQKAISLALARARFTR